MSSYHKGNAHKIPAMASKSCNAVSARDLYVPMQADVTVDETNRTFQAVITAYCYFGTRINIQNIFHGMTINGESVPNTTIDGWVKDEPGKQITTLTINGTYNAEGKPSQSDFEVNLHGQMTYYKDVGCTETKEMPFSNVIVFQVEDIDPAYTQPATPVIDSVTSLDDALLIDLHTTSFGEGGGKYLYIESSKTSNFATIKQSDVISTLSGTVRISNLQKNTKYYIRAVAANNGMRATSVSQQTATLAASEITKITPTSNTGADVSVSVYNGGGTNSVSTQLQKSTDGGTNWTNVGSASTSSIPYTTSVSGLTAGQTVLFRTQTTTSAGTFTSDAFEYSAPNGLWGWVTSITPVNGTQARVAFQTGASQNGNIKVTLYYRPYGMEEEWVSAGSQTVSRGGTGQITISNLIPNYAEYEVSLELIQGSREYNTDPVQFFTIPVQIHNDTCDSLDYLVQLICQSLNAIKQGNIVVYMNDDTKNWCEGEDGVPTLASIMSRVNRYMHTVGCILCSMEGFIELLKDANTNQVFMGKMGWVDCDDEPLDGSVNPVLSKGVYAAIEDLIRQVWHYAASYDYFAETLTELNAQPGTTAGQSGIVGKKKYIWNGSSWLENGRPVMENFGVIHINNGIYADRGYFWFVDKWHRLDADTEEIEAKITALETLTVTHSYDGNDYALRLIPYGPSDADLSAMVPTDAVRETVILLTEIQPQNDYVNIITAESSGNYQQGGN